MDKLTSMTVFVRVAKSGSFAAGARELGISRAMATKHIMHLEGALGSRLFNRTTRSLNLTDVGASYLERCQEVLLDIEEMEAAVTHLQTQPKGVLKISAPPVIGATHVTRAVVDFLKIHPDIKVDIALQSSPGDMIDEGIDVAIVLGTLDDTSMVARRLATSPVVVCGSPEYLAKNGVPKTPEDLMNHSCLVNWAIPPRHKWQFRNDQGLKIINVSGRLQANAAHSTRIAAINGLGLVMLPTYIVGGDIEKGLLKVVLENYALKPLDIHAVYPHRRYLSAKVRTFLDFLQEWLEPRAGLPSIE